MLVIRQWIGNCTEIAKEKKKAFSVEGYQRNSYNYESDWEEELKFELCNQKVSYVASNIKNWKFSSY